MTQLQKTNDLGPALLLMLLAPLLTEVLPGATRFSSLFVLPIEICVWGGGSLMIRYAVRRWQLGWTGMLLLAFSLVIAEEFLIQQTSIAPMVIRLKGETYARAFGINYVYFMWALIYESTLVVFLPIALVEMIFPTRRERRWISKGGFFAVIPLFLLGSLLAWFSWTRIARPKVFHMPIYTPPLTTIAIAFAIMAALIFTALTRFRNTSANRPANSSANKSTPVHPVAPLQPPAPWLLAIASACWASLLFGLVLLGFGIQPDFPPTAAMAGGLFLLLTALFWIPRLTASPRWQQKHSFFLIFGIIVGSMSIGFVGFIGATGPDLYFKIITNIIALTLLILLGLKVSKENKTSYHAIQQ